MKSAKNSLTTSPVAMNHREDGIAIVIALVITLIVAVLLTVGSIWVVSGLRGGGVTASRNQLVQLADGVSDQARILVVQRYQASKLSPSNFLKVMDQERLAGKKFTVTLGDGTTALWAVRGVSGKTDKYGWIDIHATVRQGQSVQTVIRRISFGGNSVFNLAMLAETTNCMYCHLRVKGDVGSLDFLRPGWGDEGGGGKGSGAENGGSAIDGDLYVAQQKGAGNEAKSNVSNDDASNVDPQDPTKTTKINGAAVTGVLKLRYNGSFLPDDTDGDTIPDFPPIDKETARANALGTLRITPGTYPGAGAFGVPVGGNIEQNRQSLSGVGGVYDGNLVLVGTPSNPINLDGDIYVTGDVMIKGVVTGRGAIYSGRNTYIAGNLTAQNGPDTPGSGVCAAFGIAGDATAQQKTAMNNACAQANVAANKDEVRLGARGSTVVGDYTERNAAGDVKPYDQRQSADYYRAQFGLGDSGKTFYFDSNTGEELTKKADGVYRTVDGRAVSTGSVTARTGGGPDDQIGGPTDAYSYAMRPGSVSGGNFTPWMSDTVYRDVMLGSQDMTLNSWRADIGGKKTIWFKDAKGRDKSRTETTQEYYDRLKPALIASRISPALADTVLYNILNNVGGTVSDNDLAVNVSGGTIRVMIAQKRSYETQVKRIDAFMYANRRIAGKVSMSPLAINGGVIAKEIGILAPGRTSAWWMPNKEPYTELNKEATACGSGTPSFVPGTEDCAFTLNYDYRLRNGGYGYNLVKGNVGQTIVWQIADSAIAQVNP